MKATDFKQTLNNDDLCVDSLGECRAALSVARECLTHIAMHLAEIDVEYQKELAARSAWRRKQAERELPPSPNKPLSELMREKGGM